ncbi:MAG: carboxypeptidase-like regulatory domain-containing protein [Bacteroidota bacterium]
MRSILLAFLMAWSMTSYAQRITIQQTAISLQDLFKEMRKQGKFDFLYNEAIVRNVKPISINLKNVSISQALDSILVNLPLTYTIQEKLVVITQKEEFVKLKGINYTVKGIIRNKKWEVLPGAAILLGGYKIGTSANDEGRFELRDLAPGSYNLLIQMVGYLPTSKNVIISNKSQDLDIFLEENVGMLTEVVIRPDPYRSEYLKAFIENFIGTSPNSKKCEFINPEVIRFDYDRQNRILRASTDEFLIIKNEALGYRIKYLLQYFEMDYETHVVHFSGYPYFEELEPDQSKSRRYAKKREMAYIGSPQHFFRSLYNNTGQEQGFVINKLIKKPNSEKLADYVIDEKIRLLSDKMRKRRDDNKRKELLSSYTKMKLLPDTVEVLIREDVSRYALVQQKVPSMKTLNFNDALYIIFKGEKEPRDYRKYSAYKIKRPEDFSDYQLSLVYRLKPAPGFFENGGVLDPESLLYEGFWAYEMVADLVPMDYVPLGNQNYK